MDLTGTAALVTGGAKRVGREIVRELARAGSGVAVHYLTSAEQADSLVRELRSQGNSAIAVEGDLRDSTVWPRIVRETVEQLGGLDILVNNAALFEMSSPDTLAEFDSIAWDSMLKVNLIAPVGLCHHARAHLESGGRGRIVNLLDIAAERPWRDHLAYSASKAALSAMTKALARLMAPKIGVFGVAPGIVEFPEHVSVHERNKLIGRVPLKRGGTSEELARFIRALLENGDYFTGQIVAFDGGRSLV